MQRWLMVLLTMALSTACQPRLVAVHPVATSVQRPSQVAVYLSVRSGDEPRPDLNASNFSVSEDGQALDPAAVGLSLLDRGLAADHRTLLLLDTSGLAPGRDGDAVARAAEAFARKVGASQGVSIHAFDGSETLRPIVEAYGPLEGGDAGDAAAQGEAAPGRPEEEGAKKEDKGDAGEARQDPEALELSALAAPGVDPSRDLHGAVLRGLDMLEQALARADKPVRVGTLVVFTRGPDLAGRIVRQQLSERLDAAHAAIVVIALGDDRWHPERIGRDGVMIASSPDKLERAFAQAADRVLALERSHYLLAYCSPARAGERTLRVQVRLPGNGNESSGSLRTRFDARGFTSGCDARATPRFVVTLVAGQRGPVPAALPEGIEPAKAAAQEKTTAVEGAAKPPTAAAAPTPPAPAPRSEPSAPRAPTPAPAPPSKAPSAEPVPDFEP